MNDKIIILAEKQDCTGCSVCSDVCPTSSILMNDGGGFFPYPSINNDTCIKCGKCMKVCPSINILEPNIFHHQYFAGWTTNRQDREESTSGGVGTALASYAIKQGYAVCGVQFGPKWEVIHAIAFNEEALSAFRGSKYVQSKTLGIYKAVLTTLRKGTPVLFIGTPCQVEAIKRFIPSSFSDLLLTCEIICHGVNSPHVWSDYIKDLQKCNRSSLVSYQFRSKSHGWLSPSGSPNLRVSYTLKNGITKDTPAFKNQFHYWFGKHFILRPSCIHCRYRKSIRRADITIGDFWGVTQVLDKSDVFAGVSAVIASSERGLAFLQNVQNLTLQPVEESTTVSVLLGYVEKKSQEQQMADILKFQRFEQQYIKNGYSFMKKKYPHPNGVKMFIHKVFVKLGLNRE